MRRLARLLKIIRVMLAYRLDTFFADRPLQWPLRLLLSPTKLLPAPTATRAVRLRKALQALGPIFVKFGQLLSTRRDLLPADLADELALLQDQVEPFDSHIAIDIIESALGDRIDQTFANFDATPLASASVAQVHSAELLSGEQVVIKVIRPGIEKTIAQDIKLLFLIARLVERYSSDGRRLRPIEVVSDYQQIIFDELDLQREAANSSQLKRNFETSHVLQVPTVYWDWCTPTILTMERMQGIPVSDIEALNNCGTDLQLLAERGVEIFFTQVFEHNFFHADMHPGNIFVDATDPKDPVYIALDCAIMGSLSDFDRHYLARNLLAVFNRDYRQVAQLHIECGWVPEGTDAHAFESMIRSACEPVFDKPLAEISFGTLLIYLFGAARRFGMEVQPSLVLLQKTLLNIEGLGRQLYPALDLWQTAHPFLEKWVQDKYSPFSLFAELRAQSPSLLESLPELPDLVFGALRKYNQTRSNQEDLSRRLALLEQGNLRLRHAALGIAIIAFAAAWLQFTQ